MHYWIIIKNFRKNGVERIYRNNSKRNVEFEADEAMKGKILLVNISGRIDNLNKA